MTVTSVWYHKTAHPWLESNTREWRANGYAIAVRVGEHAYEAGGMAIGEWWACTAPHPINNSDGTKRLFDWTWITLEDLYVRRYEHWESVQLYWRNMK